MYDSHDRFKATIDKSNGFIAFVQKAAILRREGGIFCGNSGSNINTIMDCTNTFLMVRGKSAPLKTGGRNIPIKDSNERLIYAFFIRTFEQFCQMGQAVIQDQSQYRGP